MELLKEIAQAWGVSGREKKVREIVIREVSPYADELFTDAMGNLIVHKKGTGAGKKIMLAAHMDEIGLQVKKIEVDGRIAAGGGIAFAPFQPTPFDLSQRRAWVVNVYTEPAFRRRGLATQVLEAVIGWCREEKMKAVFLHASDAGRPLYDSLGFTPTTEMRLVLG